MGIYHLYEQTLSSLKPAQRTDQLNFEICLSHLSVLPPALSAYSLALFLFENH